MFTCKRIYGSILDSSSQERISTANHSSKDSKVLSNQFCFHSSINYSKEENNLSQLNVTVERKRRIPSGKKSSSPAKKEVKSQKTLKRDSLKDISPLGPIDQNNSKTQYNSLNRCHNGSTLKERLREIYRLGETKKSKSKGPRKQSCDGLNQVLNYSILNESMRIDSKDTNRSFICPMQPKLNGKANKTSNKKKTSTSIQCTPKKTRSIVIRSVYCLIFYL